MTFSELLENALEHFFSKAFEGGINVLAYFCAGFKPITPKGFKSGVYFCVTKLPIQVSLVNNRYKRDIPHAVGNKLDQV